MKYNKIAGLDKNISKLIMGNDNQTNYDEASKLWDYWIEVGGNAFDNAHIYGNGLMEKLLGKWQRSRNILKNIILIAKGAHTPNCNPDSLFSQLEESLERLQCNNVDIYIMHRDNKEIPVGEFIDVLNDRKSQNKFRIFGASNWSLERFIEANVWAKNNNKLGFSILNNNLSLCKMIKPLWDGCVSSNDDKILDYLEKTKTAHLSWSSQGRGYFLSNKKVQEIENQISKYETWRKPGEHSSGPLSCFDSKDNRERKKRSILLAKKLNTTCQNIAGAWPINLNFPSFALIGPRNIQEINSCLNNLDIKLSINEINWLNLNEKII